VTSSNAAEVDVVALQKYFPKVHAGKKSLFPLTGAPHLLPIDPGKVAIIKWVSLHLDVIVGISAG